MPTIEISHSDLNRLIERELTLDELRSVILYAKGEVEAVEGDDLIKIEIKDTNRPDLWSTEGIAREIRGRLNEQGLLRYSVGKSEVIVTVDSRNKKVRPYTVCAVVKNLKIDKEILSQMIQLQEKVAMSFGRNRSEVAIGYYDLDKIKSPIKFTTVKPDGVKFAPLDFDKEMTPKEILEKHPKGKEYGHLLKGFKEFPMFIDANDDVLSIPPIINSNISGKVTENTRNIFIECSGFKLRFLVPALNVLVAALADRGALIESVDVYYGKKKMVTPDFRPKKFSADVDYINEVVGMKLSVDEICELLKKARYDVIKKGKKIELLYPAYRQDIMHQSDIAEDVIISMNYNKIKPEWPRLKTLSGNNPDEIKAKEYGDRMADLGFHEIISYNLTNKENLFDKMNLKRKNVIEIENPTSSNWSVFRNWILPNIVEFLSLNQHVSYPQKIFEIGFVMDIDNKSDTKSNDRRVVGAAIANSRVSYSEMLFYLDQLMKSFKLNYKLRKSSHSSFIDGRVAEVIHKGKPIGIIGELSPYVLKNWKLEMPVVAFEIFIDEL